MNMENKRIEWLDISRGILIVLVVIGHVVSSYHAANLYRDAGVMNFTRCFIYSFHMASFMMISGLLYRNKEDKLKQIKGILLSYGIPYIFFSIVWFLFKLVLRRFVNTELNLLDLILIPFFPISFLWFIYALMIMEVIQVFIHNSKSLKYLQLFVALGLYIVSPLIRDIRLFSTDYLFSDTIISDVMSFYIFFTIGALWGNKIVGYIGKKSTCVLIFGGYINIIKYPYIYRFNN